MSTDATYTFDVEADRDLVAVFAEDAPPTPVYSISVSASPSDGCSVTGGGNHYEENTSVTVIATPSTGYKFVRWTEGGSQVSTDATYTFTATTDRTLVAVFEQEEQPPTPITYSVSVNASPSVGGTVTGGGTTFTAGDSATVTATAAAGYEFKGWTENGSQVSTSASYTFAINANHILTAVFEKIVVPTYTVSISANPSAGGTVTGSGTYQSGTSVTVRAIANIDYQFVEWQSGGSQVSSNATYNFTVRENLELIAVFEKKQTTPQPLSYSVDVSASPAEGGSVTGGGIFTKYTSTTVTATANSGYKFVRWVEGGTSVSTTASYMFTVTENRTLTAVFELETPDPVPTYTISVNASPTAGGTITGGNTYQSGDPVTITATPNDGYKFVEWRLGDSQISTTASYTFAASATQTYTAIFEKIDTPTPPGPTPTTYTISVSANPTAGGTISGGGSYEENTSVTVTATANTNYRFTGWVENDNQVNASATYTFTANADRNLEARFSYIGGSSSNNPGNNNQSTGSTSTTPSIPVSTTETNTGVITTASPTASTKGDTATSVITSTIAAEIIKQAVAGNSKNVIIVPVISGNVTRTEVSIPAATLGEIGRKTDADVTISTPVADVTIPSSGLSDLSSGSSVTVTTQRTGDAVELTITAGGQTAEHISGGVSLTVPVEDATPGTVAVIVQEDGTRQVIRKSVAHENTITIPLDGSAKLVIINNAKTFVDVPGTSWAANAVAFASGHELFNGTSRDTFSPDSPMTRGMLAVVLHNLENNPEQIFSGAFSDVSGGTWYSDAVTWAAERGIVSGYGNGLFGPGDNITREQLAVVLWRYAGEPAATDKELHFNDGDTASGYAVDALRWAIENGIINGKGGGILDPKGLATRAQVAQMLMNYLKK